jgi:PAS domain S-box-containing protein
MIFSAHDSVRRAATRISLIYLIAGFAWIFFSDELLGQAVPYPDLFIRFQTVKGWFFVLVTGALLYVLLERHFRVMEASREELREQHRRLNTLLGNLPGLAYRCADDPQWTMEFLSDGCLALTGYPPEALRGNRVLSYAETVHEDDIEELRRVVRAALDKGEQFRHVYRIRTAGGAEKWVWEQGGGIRDARGRIVAIEGFVTDVSDLKRLETEMRRAQKLEAVGRMAGGAAHDFNNLLTTIGGHARLLRNGLGGDDRAVQSLSAIEGAVQRGSDLVAQLMSLSRPRPEKFERVDLNEIVAGMERLFLPLLGKSIRLSVRLLDEPAVIEADRGQIEQILMNLMVNARDAMPRGGDMAVSVRRSTSPRREAMGPGDPRAADYVLEVADTGEGMTEETKAHIFEPFYTTKPEGVGNGLGLSTVEGIVTQHHGSIEVASECGRGTTFTVRFPARSGSVPPC